MHNMYTPEWMYELNSSLPIKIDNNTPITSIALLDQCRKKIYDYITEEKVNTSVNEFYLCNWGFIESVLWTKANKGWEIEEKKPIGKSKASTDSDNKQMDKIKEDNNEEMDEDNTLMVTTTKNTDILMTEDEVKWPKEVALLLEDTCKYYWLTCLGIEHPFPKSKMKHEFPEMSRSDFFLLTELLTSRQTLYTSFNFILSELLTCLEKDAVIYRTKALKAIGKIAAEVPEIMEDKQIRTSVVQRIHDSSPSVRDAAVDVVAKYLGRLETIPIKLYEIVNGRIMDTAVNVRKRLVKLLQGLYFKFTDIDIKIDIASKLILRISDNEVTISQLSLKATQEILFSPFREIEKDGNDYFGYSYANSPKSRKQKITSLTQIITGAVSKIDPSTSTQNAALSQIIQKTIDNADEKMMLWYGKVFQWIVDSLFDRMILLDEEDNSVEFINCLATVYSFTKISGDWTKAHYVLTIYRDVLPYMKYHAPEFIQSVERLLMQLLSHCPLNLITDGVSCLCVIIDLISHKYNILIKMLGSCITKLQQVRFIISNGNDPEAKTYSGVLKMLMICGLLCQHFEFDKKREEEPEQMEALNLVYKGNICTLVFDLLQFFTSESMDELKKDGMTMRMTALQGLGYFYASHPTFMISPTSTNLMDKIFEEGSSNELKIQLMRVFQEFLSAEEKRLGKREQIAGESLYTKDIDIDTLLGNTEEYAELGVNGSLMQRYLRKILRCALAESNELRYAAFEVVSAVIHQGLAHPVLCMPVIVAAETSPDIILRNKAYYLHRFAHDKYGNLLYIQINEYLSTSYQYQKILLGSSYISGYGKRGGDAKVDSVLGITYSVLKEKRKPKMDFLSALVKPFEFDLKNTTSDEIDIGYLRYLAENILTLDLANTEEVLHMVYIMDRILMTLGADLLQYVHFLKKQGVVSSAPETFIQENEDNEIDSDFTVASKLAIAMCILLYIKNLLVELYDIPDE
ncbi:sister chromatid cohesion C-terminus-domain-containing protein [Cokeromyces recurvatus]|uniref:sister chromatid cohesion C-terminus-domain-containing protein n=1 Tax=Cokeromyces recurvatus TaxID=90255 RepID=UPI00222105FF|nr:sister chromatid cohesion C-terminus-domain-containing protein [Cokeromyces recurvatus]KAI7900013.1 sister chromatid cohesion C-terminus-domain-containing protein [Cokeromyces recurvatus]